MMKSYNELYLSDGMKNLGGMLDYAVNDCGFAADEILNMFIISGKADLFGTSCRCWRYVFIRFITFIFF